MYELRPKKVPTDTFRAGQIPLVLLARWFFTTQKNDIMMQRTQIKWAKSSRHHVPKGRNISANLWTTSDGAFSARTITLSSKTCPWMFPLLVAFATTTKTTTTTTTTFLLRQPKEDDSSSNIQREDDHQETTTHPFCLLAPRCCDTRHPLCQASVVLC